MVGLVALIADVVLLVAEINRLVHCTSPALIPASQVDFFICATETWQHLLLPIMSGVLVLFLVLSLIFVWLWASARQRFLEQRAEFSLRNTAGSSGARGSPDRRSGVTTATGTSAFTFQRDAQLFQRTALAQPPRVAGAARCRLGNGVLFALLFVICVGFAGIQIFRLDTTSFYRAPFLIVPAHVAGVILGTLFLTGTRELWLGVLLALVGAGLGVYGSIVEITRLVRCVSAGLLPLTQLDADICANEPVLRWFMPIALPISTLACLVAAFTLFQWTRVVRRARAPITTPSVSIAANVALDRTREQRALAMFLPPPPSSKRD